MPSNNVRSFLIVFSSHDLTSPAWFKVLSEAERTAALYSLSQHSTQVQIQSPGLKSNMPSSPSARTFNTSATNRQSLAFDSSSSFLYPDSANSVGNSNDATATLAQQRAKLKAASNAADRISAPALASSAGERGTWAGVNSLGQVAELDNSPTLDMTVETRSSRPQSTGFVFPLRQPSLPLSTPRWRGCLPRRPIPHYG